MFQLPKPPEGQPFSELSPLSELSASRLPASLLSGKEEEGPTVSVGLTAIRPVPSITRSDAPATWLTPKKTTTTAISCNQMWREIWSIIFFTANKTPFQLALPKGKLTQRTPCP